MPALARHGTRRCRSTTKYATLPYRDLRTVYMGCDVAALRRCLTAVYTRVFTVALPLWQFYTTHPHRRTFTAMDDEKLIELVSKYEFIYNSKHPKYMDNTRKDVAWKEIGDQLKQPIAGCKQRWQSLRDAYRRVLNKRKAKNGNVAKTTKQWKYESEMSFLIPYFVERKIYGTTETATEDEDTDNDETIASNPSCGSDQKGPENPNTDLAYENNSGNASDCNISGYLEVEVDVKETENNSQDKNKARGIKRKIVEPEQTASAIFMANLLNDQSKIEDELDRFFLNISDTVKKFTPYQQALAKNKIFTLVSEMELQQLASTSSSRYNYSPSQQSAPFNILPNTVPRPPSPDENWTDEKPHLLK